MNDPRPVAELLEAEDGTILLFDCPGCRMAHGPYVRRPEASQRPRWEWNGDLVRPTLSPSIRVQGTVPITDEERDRILRGEPFTPTPLLCHSFVRDGQIQFLSDCTHALAGQTVAIPPVED